MDNERIREICLALPNVVETVNWGHHLVYWAADRDIGGKMFAMTDIDGVGIGVLWFHCGAERFHELLETEGIIASPYLAKAHWVTLERWDTLKPRQVEDELRRARDLIFEKLPKRTKDRSGHAGEGARQVDPRAKEGGGGAGKGEERRMIHPRSQKRVIIPPMQVGATNPKASKYRKVSPLHLYKPPGAPEPVLSLSKACPERSRRGSRL